MGRDIRLTMAVMAYQALRHYRTGTVRLPRGYRLVSVIEGPGAPRVGFAAESSARLVLTFRGTEDWEDLRKGISFAQVPYPYASRAGYTHKGFTELYSGIRDSVLRLVRRLPAGKPVHVAGHSLGGAVAALCALDIASRRRHPVHLYTFGAPKAGNADFAAALDSKVVRHWRIYNPKDPVPGLPPASVLKYRYVHGGAPLPLPFNRVNPLSNHSMAAYVRTLCGTWPKSCAKLCPGDEGLCP